MDQEKITTGGIVKVSGVVCNLIHHDDQKKLSIGEKRMLAKARQIFTSELTLTCNIDRAVTAKYLDEIPTGDRAEEKPTEG